MTKKLYRDGSDPENAVCNACGYVWNYIRLKNIHSKILSGLDEVMSKYNSTYTYTLIGETLSGMEEFVTVGEYIWEDVSKLLDNFQNQIEEGSYFQVAVSVEDLNGSEDKLIDWECLYSQGMEDV